MCSPICFNKLQASAVSFRRASHVEEGQSTVTVTLYIFFLDCGGSHAKNTTQAARSIEKKPLWQPLRLIFKDILVHKI